MVVKQSRWFLLWLALGLGVGLLVLFLPSSEQARAGDPGGGVPQDVFARPAAVGGVSTLAASPPFDEGVLDISGSLVETTDCYQVDKPQTLCFTAYNGSTTGEWIDGITLTFPDDPSPSIPPWGVSSCAYQDSKDSAGYTVNLDCAIPSVNQVVYQDNEGDGWGEISKGASWRACVDVFVPPDYVGDRDIPWVLHGDGGGSASGSITIEQCTPLTLKPSQVVIMGCNGAVQTLEFELWNYGAGNTDVVLVYDAPDASFGGPAGMSIQQGQVVTFTTGFEPKLCLDVGETITASLTVQAQGSGHSDISIITQTIAESGGWRRRDDSPIPSMDNAVIWANHGDGGLWSVGGYGSGGAAQRYDPNSDEWITYTNPLPSVIQYPIDGCYGLNDNDHEIIVLFPDTVVTGVLQIFDISARSWYTRPVPVPGYPAEGRWAQDIVSMLQHTGENVCYLSGGSTEQGGGRTNNLWKYYPGNNVASYVGDFGTTSLVFGFHASWYVPWIGANGGICVAGGLDHNGQVNNTTQCYDIAANTFNGLNADLGTLPEPWWGMADGWQIDDGHYQIWIANGVAQNGTLLPASAYIQAGMSEFAYGPPIPHGLYRLEGDSWNGQFYTLNGAAGWFSYSQYSLHLATCPVCRQVYLPLVLRNH